MGTYSPTFKFYKPDPTEIVDVELNLNQNWRIADRICKGMLEYNVTDDWIPNTSDAFYGYRWYKRYSNAIWWWRSVGGNPGFYQDTYSRVYPWTSASSIIGGGWSSVPDQPAQYRLIDTGQGVAEVEWSGAVWMGGAVLPLNTNQQGVMTLPASLTPVVTKYFQCNAGNSLSDYNVARVGFFSDNDVEIKVYGIGNWTTSSERKVDLGGIKYALAVAA